MSRWASTLRLELTIQVRQKFVHAALISGLLWLALLLPIPRDVRPIIEPYVLVGDIAIIGFFFIGGSVFFEKQERTLGALICTPLRFREYLWAKVAVLSSISLVVAVIVVVVTHGAGAHLVPVVAGVALGTAVISSPVSRRRCRSTRSATGSSQRRCRWRFSRCRCCTSPVSGRAPSSISFPRRDPSCCSVPHSTS